MDAHEETRRRYFAEIQAFSAASSERLTSTSERRAAVRDELLRSMLRSAVEGSSWHRDRLVGVDIDEVTGNDLSALPTMTKTDLMENWDAIVTESTVTLNDAQRVLDAHAAREPFRFLHDRYSDLGHSEVPLCTGASPRHGTRFVAPKICPSLRWAQLNRQ